MTATLNGSACTCLNRFDRCAACRAKDAEARANPAPTPPPAPRKPAPAPKARATPPAVDQTERWLTAAQTAQLFAIGVRTLWRMVEQGHLPQPIRYTRKLIRWDYQTLVAFMRKVRESNGGTEGQA